MRKRYGEDLPSIVPITLVFNEYGYLSDVKTPPAVMPVNSSFPAYIATQFTERFSSKIGARSSYNTSPQHCTLCDPTLSFIYLDVGRWGGKLNSPGLKGKSEHRDFGIVCGGHVLLCYFSSNPLPKPKIQGSDEAAKNIEELFNKICDKKCGIEVDKWESITKEKSNPETIYIILGDLHLPIVNYNPYFRQIEDIDSGMRIKRTTTYYSAIKDETAMGRTIGELHTKLDTKSYQDLYNWYENYLYGDIFSGGEADLCLFLERIQKVEDNLPVHFIQVGDMYDLWIGLDRYYEEKDAPPGEVALRKDLGNNEPEEFIEYWIKRSKDCNSKLVQLIEGLNVKKTFLYGNHDNYLNAYNPTPNSRGKRFYRENGLYIEHGHWIDSSNYDGNKFGHWMTNWVFEDSWVRGADPQRRHFYTGGSSIEYYSAGDFKIFIMGHTHMPYLTKVNVEVECLQSKIQRTDKPRALPRYGEYL